jgi:ATP-binding cassette subfamily B (MDR/TAP) protein 7
MQLKAAEKVKPEASSTRKISKAAPAKELVTDDASKVSEKEQSLTDWNIIKRLAVNIWPKGEWEIKVRVAGALGLLVAGKVSCC